MTDKKFTDEEIINALTEDLIAATNGYSVHLENGGRIDKNQEQYIEMLTETINLINRQKAEIERLKECPKCIYEYDGEIMEYCVQEPCSNFRTVEQIKAEAYKEFAEKIKQEIKEAYDSNIKVLNEHFEKHRGCFNDTFVGIIEGKNNALLGLSDFIDSLLKEMIGGNK